MAGHSIEYSTGSQWCPAIAGHSIEHSIKYPTGYSKMRQIKNDRNLIPVIINIKYTILDYLLKKFIVKHIYSARIEFVPTLLKD